ncbi:MAG: 30S ribosome-binding factor RbfA [Bacteroidetes bacterium]|nr:30S ribosome-binding factor RbfA [Bacteroidota bacterium]
MTTTRQNKVARLVQKEIGDWFQRDGKVIFGNPLITVTTVRVTPDLSIARIYLSLFNATDKNKLLKDIEQNTSQIRKALGNRVKHQLRIVPQLEYFIDDSLDYAERIDQLLKK